MNTMLMWEGTTRQRFFEDFHRARSEMNLTIEYMNSISDELKRIAYRFILVDEELLPLALVGRTEEPKTWLEKAWGSLKEIGNGIMDASNERYDKRYSSVWGFLDYWTAGIPKGAYQGYVERADKLFDSPNDFADGMTFGVHGTIREAIFPTKAWSTEHVASIIGAAGIATSATVPLMKPKDILSPRVKYEVRKGNDGLKHGGDGGGTPKADGAGDAVQTGGRELSLKEWLHQEEEAIKMYDSIRSSTLDVSTIAKNTGIPEWRIQRIKEHIFIKEHEKSSGYGTFDPDYEIAQAWQRLQNGSHTQKDVDLLNHEIFESKFEGIFKTDYEKAHSAAEKSGRVWKP
ncbi:WXG100 family type VII secretion target [Paenibacillus solani]|uniref:WXG100 family type VII secretion target n=1 Tax=Paenibacillus solani TaxID=1705565 RepID=UPI003BF859E0